MPTTVQRSQIAWGDAGSFQTLAHMRNVINGALSNPLVVESAHYIIRQCAPRDYVSMGEHIRAWMAAHFRFVADPIGVELIRTPEYMLRQQRAQAIITGDCDDAAVLGCALAKSVGIRCELVAIGFNNKNFAHVYGNMIVRDRYGRTQRMDLDVTKPNGMVAQVRRRTAVLV